MDSLFPQLNISNSVWPFEIVAGAVNSHNTRGGQAACLSIRLVDSIMVDAGAALESSIGSVLQKGGTKHRHLTYVLFLVPVLLEVLLIWLILHEKRPPVTQAGISIVGRYLLPFQPEIPV